MNSVKSRGLVSVIIPTFNREKYIIDACQSVFKQSYRPIELIVVDDGSTDETKVSLEKWYNQLDKNEFVFKYVYQENSGGCRARNTGISLAEGVYMQNLDSDDLLHPRAIENYAHAIESNHGYDSCWSMPHRFSDDREFFECKYQKPTVERLNIGADLLSPQFLPIGFHKTEMIRRTGDWNEGLKRWQDLEFQVRLAYNLKRVLVLDFPFYWFRQHQDERVNDFFRKRSGIEHGLHTLGEVQLFLESVNLQSKSINDGLASFYLNLAIHSLYEELENQFKKCLMQSVKLRKSNKFEFKVAMLKIIFGIVGAKITLKLLTIVGIAKQ